MPSSSTRRLLAPVRRFYGKFLRPVCLGILSAAILLCVSLGSCWSDTLAFDSLGLGGEPQEFTLTNQAWNPGPNAARFGGSPGPGSATFSIMGAGFVSQPGVDNDHASRFVNFQTVPITNLIAGKTFDDIKNMINTALNIWDAPSGFTNLGYVADGNVNAGATQASGGSMGDIRVAAWNILGGTVLAHAFFPATEAQGFGGTIGGDVHIDTDFNWVDDPNAVGITNIDLLTVLIHELGHSLGLLHSSSPNSVMAANYSGARRTLSADDIAGIQAIYGTPEPGTLVLLLSAAAMLGSRRLRTVVRPQNTC